MEERRVSNKNERKIILISIFEQPFTYYKLLLQILTKDIILIQ